MHPNPPTIEQLNHPNTKNNKTWRTQAACKNIPPTQANWLPEQHHAHDQTTKNAYQICNTCPVKTACLYDALINNQHKQTGIYGGQSPRQISQLRQQLVQAGHLTHQRTCANPACNKTFPVKPNTPRNNVCCSNTCRLARRRTQQTLNRNNKPTPTT